MSIGLYGREAAVALVREFMTRPEVDGVPRSRRSPIVLFTGGRGTGKTKLLRELARNMDQRVPFAFVDCETVATDAVCGVLSALAFELNRRCAGFGRLAFPRLTTGRLVIEATLDANDHRRARDQVRAVLEEHRQVDKLRQFLADTAPGALAAIPEMEAVPGVDATGRYMPDLVLGGLISRQWGRRVVLGVGQDWYGHQNRDLGRDSFDVLVDLNRLAARPDIDDNQREVTETLWAAFLADLRENFRRGRRADEWLLNCAVLLDNVDTPAGLGFLDELIRARRQLAAHTASAPDPLTVVATSRGDLGARVAPAGRPAPTAEQASYHDYAERSEREAGRWWYPVLLRDLTHDEVGNMVDAIGLPGGHTRRVTKAVHRFTGGHPGSTRLVLDAFAVRSTIPELRVVLEELEPGGLASGDRRVEDRIIDQFLHGMPDEVVTDLVTCAAAHDLTQASRLAAHSDLLTAPRGVRADAFTPQLWTSTAERAAAVMRPVLRRLLLRRLADRGSAERANWERVHHWLQASCADDGDEPGELRHALALGQVAFVAGRLADRLENSDVAAWLDLLAAVTCAPNRLGHRIDGPPRGGRGHPMDHLLVLTRQADPREVPLTPLIRLVAALWIAADPLTDTPRRALHLEIAADFNDIAPYSPGGLPVLRVEADKHREEASLWP